MPRTNIRLSLSTNVVLQPSSLLLLHHHHHQNSTSPRSPLLSVLKTPKSPTLTSPLSPHHHNQYHKHHPSAFSSSLTSTTPQTPPPATPYPWTWRCHLCSTTYRLSTTRRCLLDGHYLCTGPPPVHSPTLQSPPPPPGNPSARSLPNEAPPSSPPLPLANRKPYVAAAATAVAGSHAAKNGRGGRKTGAGRRSGKQKPAQESHCTTLFDYLGWMEWNEWRRRRSEAARCGGDAAVDVKGYEWEEIVGKLRKDCSVDCDFPSECSWRGTGAYVEAVLEGDLVSPM